MHLKAVLVGMVVGFILAIIFLASMYFSPITSFTTITSTTTTTTTTTTKTVIFHPYTATTSYSGFKLAVYISDVEPRMGDGVEIEIVLSNIDHPNATTVCCGYTKINLADEEGDTVYGLYIKHGCPTLPWNFNTIRFEPGEKITHTITWEVQTRPSSVEIRPGKHYLTVSDCFIDLNKAKIVEFSIEPIEVSVKGR